ncbi:MAG: molecular chaperone TorD family protein [Candidatus Paceibacterota bacterium]
MPSREFPRESSIVLAAQADLVLTTVEMLRSPQSLVGSSLEPWYELPLDSLNVLLERAFGKGPKPAAMEGEPTLPDALAEVYQLARQLEHTAWSDEYWRLFDSSQACTLNQASYIRRDKGTILGDVCGFYNAFGWQASLTRGERPDHLLCQLEFVGMMLAMAAQTTDETQREVVRDALAEFARLHMHDWLPSVCYHLIDSTRITYFGAVAQWLMLLWAHLTEFHNWPIDPVPNAPLAPATDPENPYECDAPDVVPLLMPKGS